MVGGVLCLFKKISWYLEGIFLFTKQDRIALNPTGLVTLPFYHNPSYSINN